MKNILIIAAREFRQIAGMRSFWFTLLILPIAIALGPLTQRFMQKDEADRVMIIDRTGGSEASVIADRLSLDHDRDVLDELSNYVRRHHLEAADTTALWAQHDRWHGDDDIARFRAEGGLLTALAKLRGRTPKSVPEFEPPKPNYEIVAVPADLAASPDAALDAKLKPYLAPTDKDTRPLSAAVLVPSTFGASPVVRLWANSDPSPSFVAAVREVLTKDLRTRFLRGQGTSAASAQAVAQISPTLLISTPPPGGGIQEAMLVRSILPLASTYLLMMSLMLSGSWMLQGTVEERSNKLLEAVLACVSPEELMYGKLLGAVGVGLSMIAVWIGCGVVAAYATQGVIADFIRPALDPLTSPVVIMAMIYFFVVGYVTVSVLFLAIGAMSDSMREAQGYLMPVILVIILPITLLMQAVVAGSHGIGIEVLTWVPIWTPFAVLARLGAGIPAWEVIGTGITLAAFTSLELVLLGRLFRASLLAQGQRPNIAGIIARMRKAQA